MKKRIFSLLVVLMFLLGAADVYSYDEYVWKRKKGKIALYCKPDKGKGYFVTGYDYDDDNISYRGKKKEDPRFVSYTTKIIHVFKGSYRGLLSVGGKEVFLVLILL